MQTAKPLVTTCAVSVRRLMMPIRRPICSVQNAQGPEYAMAFSASASVVQRWQTARSPCPKIKRSVLPQAKHSRSTTLNPPNGLDGSGQLMLRATKNRAINLITASGIIGWLMVVVTSNCRLTIKLRGAAQRRRGPVRVAHVLERFVRRHFDIHSCPPSKTLSSSARVSENFPYTLTSAS